MSINIKQEKINLRETLNRLDKPTGVAGEAMLRADTPQEQFNMINAGRRNLLINGDFRIAQRTTSSSAPGDGYGQYLAVDRWATYRVGQRFTQDDAIIDGRYKRVLKVAPSNLGYLYLYQVIENGSSIISDKTVSLSFWAKADTALTIRSGLRYANDANGNFVLNDAMRYFDLDSEWQYYTTTMRLEDTLMSSDYTRNAWLMLFHDTAFTGSNNVYFADIQLELGETATPFEQRSYAEEFALCERYYQRHELHDTAFVNYNNVSFYGEIRWRHKMRDVPSIELKNNDTRFYPSGNASVFGANGSQTAYLQSAHVDGARLWFEPTSSLTNPVAFVRQLIVKADADF